MIYYVLITLAVTAVGLLIYALLFDRRYFFGLLVVLVICTGFLSYYIFYYIGSYKSSDSDLILNVNLESCGNGNYKLDIDSEWRNKPKIFGFNGSDDILAVRYRPDMYEVLSSDISFNKSPQGKISIKVPSKFTYSKISKKEKEIYFPIEDGQDTNITVTLKMLNPGGEVKVFYIHDYKVPLDLPVYWEKYESLKP